MKRLKKWLVTIFVALLPVCIGIACASCVAIIPNEEEFGELVFSLNDEGTAYSVINYEGNGKKVVIPASYNDLPVTSIEKEAFSSCSSLTSVTIASGVTSIAENAFTNSGNLASIEVDENNTAYSSMDGVLFDKTQTTLLCYPAGKQGSSYTIADSVTSIGNYAFFDCSKLTSVEISNSVTDIGYGAFWCCYSLTSIEIPNGVTSIGKYAFSDCESATSVTIPHSVTSIGYGAFESCSSLTSVTIPNSVTRIREYSFSNCSSLTSITIEDGVTIIGQGAFGYCSSLTSVIIPDSVTSIDNYAFRNCGSLESVTIGKGVTKIGISAFESCDSLASVVFKNTSGWSYIVWSSATGGGSIASEDLADSATAAKYLKGTYCENSWKRSEE